MAETDPFELVRFLKAQYPVFDTVLAELRQGDKRTHWMWFIFPQIQGLGLSSTAKLYAIASLAEAIAYLEHPVLGPRLRECVRLVNAVEGRSAERIFGGIDATKLRSCLTLFKEAAPDEPLFQAALQKYYDGKSDPQTLKLLGRTAG